MRSIDLGLIRKQLGDITLPDGRKVKVYEPTIGQLLSSSTESRKVSDDLSKLSEKKDTSAIITKRTQWLVREVQIFVPELSDEDVKNLTYQQRDKILALVYGIEEEEAEEKKIKPPKSAKSRKG